MTSPLSDSADTTCLGRLAEPVEASLRELEPAAEERAHAVNWLSCAAAPIVDAFGITGRFATSGTAEAAFRSYADQASDWTREAWAESPLAMVSPDLMVATLLSSMHSVQYELNVASGDTSAIDWLWSPFGPPIRGNGAHFDGRDRHMAHIALAAAAAGQPDIDPKATLDAAELHVTQMMAADEAKTAIVAQRRAVALDELDAKLAVANQEGRGDEVVGGLLELFLATGEAMQHVLLTSCSQTEFPLEAFGWASMTVRRITDWTSWVRNAIDEICRDDAGVRFACWSAADLLMRVLAYEVIHAEVEAAALHLACDLIGRPASESASAGS